MNRFSITIALTLAASAAAQWHAKSPATTPPLRVIPGMVYDSARGHTLMFGGAQTGLGNYNDTWTWNGTNWTLLNPATRPSARPGIELACDTLRGVVVLYGGGNASPFGGASIDQTWEWNGTTWTQVFPATTPGGLGGYGFAYDAARSRTVLYGGVPDSFFPIAAGGTWEYDGNDWAQITTASSPGPLEYPSMCYDSANSRVVLFGGIDPQIGGTSTTWVYNGSNWTALSVAGTLPPARSRAKMVYDGSRGVCILHGGADPMTGSPMNDTWEFDGASWTDVTNGTAMSVRYGHGMAFDAVRRQAVLFGGVNGSFAGVTGTFEYGAAFESYGSGCAGSNGVPVLASTSVPRIGATFTTTLGNLRTGAVLAAVATGFSTTSWSLGALPADLSGFGLTGCTLYVSPDAVTFLGVASGIATWNAAIPNAAILVGMPLAQQGLSLDAGVNPAGAVVSNAARGIVGH
jgi:hypothetical protein